MKPASKSRKPEPGYVRYECPDSACPTFLDVNEHLTVNEAYCIGEGRYRHRSRTLTKAS